MYMILPISYAKAISIHIQDPHRPTYAATTPDHAPFTTEVHLQLAVQDIEKEKYKKFQV